MQGWRNGFAQSALDTIDAFIEANKSELKSSNEIAEQIELLLDKARLGTDSEQYAGRALVRLADIDPFEVFVQADVPRLELRP